MRCFYALLAAVVLLSGPAHAASLPDLLATNVDLVSESGRFVCSGVIVQQAADRTRVLSAEHCLGDAKAVQTTTYDAQGYLLAIERVYIETVMSDSMTDLWLLETKRPIPGVAATFDPAVTPQAGDEVWAVTSPLGLSKSVAKGWVANPRSIVPDFRRRFVLQAAITGVAGGSSGGGLFDTAGRLVGITSFGAPGTGVALFATVRDIEVAIGWHVYSR